MKNLGSIPINSFCRIDITQGDDGSIYIALPFDPKTMKIEVQPYQGVEVFKIKFSQIMTPISLYELFRASTGKEEANGTS